MKWYWIVLIVVGYIAMWFVTSVVISRKEKSKDVGYAIVGASWPIILAALPFYGICELCYWFIKKYGKEEEHDSAE